MVIDNTGARLLEGLLVVELGRRIAAGSCGSLMADLGADVIAIEDKERPRTARAQTLAGKRSLTFDGNSEEDRNLLSRLLNVADVVLLSSDCGAIDQEIWGRARPERQIICDFTAYGHTGPLAGKPHSEAMVQAVAAIAGTTGRPDGPPTFTGAPFLDMETAVYALAAILAASIVCRTTGKGQRIDMALYDVGVNALLTFVPLVLIGRSATRAGNRHPTLACWNAYCAKDGWVLICGPSNDQWRRLCIAMDRPELSDHPDFRTPSSRFANIDAVDSHVGAWVSGMTAEHCLALVSKQGIPCSPIISVDDLAKEPNLVHRGMILHEADRKTGSILQIAGNPIRVTGVDAPKTKEIPEPDADRLWCSRRIAAFSGNVSLLEGNPAFPGLPLEGLRVIEIGMNTVAPLACRQLGALGADVIKVEPPIGDSNRINAPLREDGEAYIFALSNTDKRGIVLDLKKPADRDKLWALVATADVVMENLKPGSLDKLGFGAVAVRDRFPKIVYCSVNGFGYDSAYPGRPALDTVIQGMSGAMAVTPVDGVPTKSGISVSDQLGGQFGLAGILAALVGRGRTGRGVHLDIAMQDCSAWATQARWNGSTQELPMIIKTFDGYVAIESDWERASDRLATSASTSSATLLAALDDLGVNAVQVATVREVMEHPQTRARDLLKMVPTADGSEWLVLGSPLKLMSTPAVVRAAMPRLGFPAPGLAEEFAWTEQYPSSVATTLRLRA
jgi:crotonobetainyl-CoA:carnitine CoA-transferase CaiB-like acyl-CoA transferase